MRGTEGLLHSAVYCSLMTALVVAVPSGLGSGSYGFHYRHGNGPKRCSCRRSHGDGNVTGARSHLHRGTNDTGLYRIAQLPVGTYDLKVEKPGFALASYPPFVLTLNQVARIDVAMKVGQASETVEVTGATPVLETEVTQVDTIINAATNDNLPLASRNYVQLTLLAPGTVSTDPSQLQ